MEVSMTILETKDLRKVYGSGEAEVRALDGIDLTVNDGEFVAVVGSSGSGKSTLLHMLGGLDRPTSGTVIVDGQDLSAFGPVGLAKAVVRSIIQKGALWETMWHFWYLAALMILYLLLPLLYRLYVGDQSPDDRFSSLFRLWAGLALVGILAQLISYCIGQPFQKFFCQTFRLWTWLQYLVLGGLAPRLRTRAEKRLPLPLHGLCLFLMTVYVMVYQNIVGRGLLHNLYAEYFYDDAFTVFWVLLLYTFLLRVPIPRLLHRILEIMSPLTLGIYIVHPLFLKAVRTYYPSAGLKVALITYLAVFTASALSVLIMSRIPVIRKLVSA